VGRLTGGLQGDLEFTITSLTPAEPSGVLLLTARSTIHTNEGQLFCLESGSYNTASGSEGEGVHLCVITGGTEGFEGASGYLEGRFYFHGTVGEGEYRGKIITASRWTDGRQWGHLRRSGGPLSEAESPSDPTRTGSRPFPTAATL
jgi:hypothetical protein